MLLKQIQYFITVVDCHSFTEAAARSYISQSAVSQQIKALEYELGVQLLRRGKRKFTLTEAGKYFYETGKELLRETEALCSEVRRLGLKESSGRINIGYLKLYSGKELQAAIALFCQQYPDVVVNVRSCGHEELYRGIAEGRFDFVMTDESFEEKEGLFECVMLKENNVYIDISEQYELSRKPYVDAGAPNRNIPIIAVVDKEQRESEKAFYNWRYKGIGSNFIFVGDWGEARMLAAAGAGCIVVENLDGAFAPSAGMRRVPVYLDGEPLKWHYYFIRRQEKQSTAKKYLAELVVRQFKTEQQ